MRGGLCPDTSAYRPSEARGYPCHFPRLNRPSPSLHPSLPCQSTHLIPQGQLTPLHWAAEDGDEAACRVLIEAGAKVDAWEDVSWHCV